MTKLQLILLTVVGVAACGGEHPPDGNAAERLISEFNSAMAVNDSGRLLALSLKMGTTLSISQSLWRSQQLSDNSLPRDCLGTSEHHLQSR